MRILLMLATVLALSGCASVPERRIADVNGYYFSSCPPKGVPPNKCSTEWIPNAPEDSGSPAQPSINVYVDVPRRGGPEFYH
jgi:hypothetical protein